jgi:hypothetical protein
VTLAIVARSRALRSAIGDSPDVADDEDDEAMVFILFLDVMWLRADTRAAIR